MNTEQQTNQNTNLEDALRSFTRELPVKLSEPELQVYGKMLADKIKEEELAVEKKQQIAKQLQQNITVIRNEISRIADARAKGEELRPVKCTERLRNGVIEITRSDTSEVVDVRPADLRDLQTTIPGTDGDHLEATNGADVGPPGEMVTSSTGGQVYNGAPDDRDEDVEDEFDTTDAEPDSEDGDGALDHVLDAKEAGDEPDGEVDTDPFPDGGAAASSSRAPRHEKNRGSAGKAKTTNAPKKSTKRKR